MDSKRFVVGTLALCAAVLALCAALVWYADPCFYFRFPGTLEPVFFNERYQNAGMAKNTDADTVIMGTSMVANYRVSEAESLFGGTAVKLSFPDGYLSEFDQMMDVVFRYEEPERVIFGMDINILIRDESGVTGALPEYLYDVNPLNDVKYFFNKDTLYYSLYRIRCNQWDTTQTVDEAFTWDVWWSKATALAGYPRPEVTEEQLPEDAYDANAMKNMEVVAQWANAHPETEFHIFFPPYSILFWDKMERTGATDAVFSAVETGIGYLIDLCQWDNVHVHFFPDAEEIVTNLDNYGDYIHHSGTVCTYVLEEIAAGSREITPLTRENVRGILSSWREFVVNYDYEAIWAEETAS